MARRDCCNVSDPSSSHYCCCEAATTRSSIQFAVRRRILEFPVKMLLQFRNCIFALNSVIFFFHFLFLVILFRCTMRARRWRIYCLCMLHLVAFNEKEKTFLLARQCCPISSWAKPTRNMFARGDISTTTTESINIFLLHINTMCESCCRLAVLLLLLLLCGCARSTIMLYKHEKKKKITFSLCVACRRPKPFRFERLLLSILELHTTNSMHCIRCPRPQPLHTMQFASISSRCGQTMDPMCVRARAHVIPFNRSDKN